MNLINKFKTDINSFSIEKENSGSNVAKVAYAVTTSSAFLAVTNATVMADGNTGLSNIETKVDSTFKDIYSAVKNISTIAAVCMFVIALFVRMVSKNDRTVQEFTTWAKRIIITWIVIHCVGWLVNYGKDLTNGGDFNTTPAQ